MLALIPLELFLTYYVENRTCLQMSRDVNEADAADCIFTSLEYTDWCFMSNFFYQTKMYSWLIKQQCRRLFTLVLLLYIGHILGSNMSSSEIQASFEIPNISGYTVGSLLNKSCYSVSVDYLGRLVCFWLNCETLWKVFWCFQFKVCLWSGHQRKFWCELRTKNLYLWGK